MNIHLHTYTFARSITHSWPLLGTDPSPASSIRESHPHRQTWDEQILKATETNRPCYTLTCNLTKMATGHVSCLLIKDESVLQVKPNTEAMDPWVIQRWVLCVLESTLICSFICSIFFFFHSETWSSSWVIHLTLINLLSTGWLIQPHFAFDSNS